MDRPLKIGVLSLQGSVEEHLASLRRLPQVTACPVKTLSALQEVDGLILPGGESTTICLLYTSAVADGQKGRQYIGQ